MAAKGSIGGKLRVPTTSRPGLSRFQTGTYGTRSGVQSVVSPTRVEPATGRLGVRTQSAFTSVQTPGGGGPAATSAVKPTPKRTYDPRDSQFVDDARLLEKQRDTTLNSLGEQRTGTRLDYGYSDDAGNVVDPSNPFSRAALLKRLWDQGRAGDRTSFAARRQLYSGAYGNARSFRDFNEMRKENANKTAFAQALAAIARGETDARTRYEIGIQEALGRGTARGLAQGD